MRRDEDKSEKRKLILQAAVDCFIANGFHATSMRDIAEAASVSLGNLYNYFSGKEALIAEVAVQEQLELMPLLEMIEHKSNPDSKTIRNFLYAYSHLCKEHDRAVLTAECLAEIARTPSLIPAFNANHKRLVTALTNVILLGVSQGKFLPLAPAGVVAQLLLDGVEGDAIRYTLMPSTELAQDTSGDFLHSEFIKSLLGES